MSKKVATSWSLTIHGREWKVLAVTRQDMVTIVRSIFGDSTPDDLNAQGMTIFRKYLILVDVDLIGTPGFMDTLSHEIVHAMTADLAQMGQYNDELVAEVIGRELFKVSQQLVNCPKSWRVV